MLLVLLDMGRQGRQQQFTIPLVTPTTELFGDMTPQGIFLLVLLLLVMILLVILTALTTLLIQHQEQYIFMETVN